MLKVKCKINKTNYMHGDNIIEVYGLTFFKDGNECEIIKIIECLFTSFEKIKRLHDLINNNDLDELHILDVCEDAILDYDFINPKIKRLIC